jgi:predicted amino acid-binding ACT domain protein
MISMFTPASASASNMSAATPGWLFIPAPISETFPMSGSHVKPAASTSAATSPRIRSAFGTSSFGSVNELSVCPSAETFCTIMSTFTPASASGRKTRAAIPGRSGTPRIVPEARKLDTVTYEEMLDLAACGAKVLMLRAVEYARNHAVALHVRSSFSEAQGTRVVNEELSLERAIISGIAHDTSEAKATIRGVPVRPGIAARVFRPLADAGVNVDMIVQNVSAEGHTDISFTLPKEDLPTAEKILSRVAAEIDAAGFTSDPDIAKVSLIGAGMKSHPGVAADMFDALAEAGVNIEIISTSSIRVSCVVSAADVERAVRAVHDRFELADAN